MHTSMASSIFVFLTALIKGINEFNGGIVCVTHDQRLIDECECELWVVQEQDAKKWPEGFDDYKSDILDKIEKRAAEEEKMRNEKIEAAAKVREEKMKQLKAKLGK